MANRRWTTTPKAARQAPGTVEDMIAARQLRRVTPDRNFQLRLLERAASSINSANRILDSDPEGAFVLAYDAIRHSVDAHLNTQGLRVESGDGGHLHRVRYADMAMTGSVAGKDVDRYRQARQLRNKVEYPEPNDIATVNETTAKGLIATSKRFLRTVGTEVGSGQTGLQKSKQVPSKKVETSMPAELPGKGERGIDL